MKLRGPAEHLKARDTMRELDRMLSGGPYTAADAELTSMRRRARALVRRFNESSEDDLGERERLLRDLLGSAGHDVFIEPPFRCDYGSNIAIGDGSYLNFDCVILDCHRVTIGRRVLLGPGVHLYAAFHPIDAAERALGPENSAPIAIGDDVWIGGRAVVLAGVTIGARTIVGAGTVVTRDLPEGVVAAGNPCRILRRLE
jgi:maltose O-acetyltransferase